MVGAKGDDSSRIDVVVGDVVVAFDVVKVHGLSDARLLVEIAEVTVEVRIINDAADVAFEVSVIHRVETDQRAEEPPIRFDNALAEEITPGCKPRFQLILGGEEGSACPFIGPL